MVAGLLDRLTGGAAEALSRPVVTLDFGGGGAGPLGGLAGMAGIAEAPPLAARLRALVIERGLAPAVDRAVVTLVAQADAAVPGVGDAGSIGIAAGGARGAFACSIAAVSDVGGRIVELAAGNGGGALARLRVNQSFVDLRPSEIIADLAGRAGVAVAGGAAGEKLSHYAADDRRTALEHVARLAATAGRIAAFDDAGALCLIDDAAGGEPAAVLRRGEALLDWHVGDRLPHTGALTLDGAGVEGGGARWAWLRKEPGPMRLAAGAGDPARRGAAPWVRSPQGAGDLGAALVRAGERRTGACRFLATAQPAVAPGSIVALEGVAAGHYRVTAVVHRLDAEHGLTTEISAAPAADAGGGLLGALGGLL